MNEALGKFRARWLEELRRGVRVAFETGAPSKDALHHAGIADEFVSRLGLAPIGFNWELLDAGGDRADPRSAKGQLESALANDIANPSQEWLGKNRANACARDFLSGFDAARLTIVSNRYDGLWNPISGAPVEWGFVAFDEQTIAVLLLAAD